MVDWMVASDVGPATFYAWGLIIGLLSGLMFFFVVTKADGSFSQYWKELKGGELTKCELIISIPICILVAGFVALPAIIGVAVGNWLTIFVGYAYPLFIMCLKADSTFWKIIGVVCWFGALGACMYAIFYGITLDDEVEVWKAASISTTCYLVERKERNCSYSYVNNRRFETYYGTLYDYTAIAPETCDNATNLTNIEIVEDCEERTKTNFTQPLNVAMNCFVNNCEKFLLDNQEGLNNNPPSVYVHWGIVYIAVVFVCGITILFRTGTIRELRKEYRHVKAKETDKTQRERQSGDVIENNQPETHTQGD